jgi:hypothetical protein
LRVPDVTDPTEPACSSSPCLNGGVCENLVLSNYMCNCVGSFYGANCELDGSSSSSPLYAFFTRASGGNLGGNDLDSFCAAHAALGADGISFPFTSSDEYIAFAPTRLHTKVQMRSVAPASTPVHVLMANPLGVQGQ